MKKSVFILFIICSFVSVVNAQNSDKIGKHLKNHLEKSKRYDFVTVWIFFTDKGNNTKSLSEIENNYNPKAVERRKKLLKDKALFDFRDIPVNENYISKIKNKVVKIRHKSKWLNAVSAEIFIKGKDLKHITELPFVKRVELVLKGNRLESFIPYNEKEYFISGGDYGESYHQIAHHGVDFFHQEGYTGEGITICMMDAGFNFLEHEVFGKIKIADTWDFVNNDANVDDQVDDMGSGSHGTMTLSTIGGYFPGKLIAPAYNATFLLAKTENTKSETQTEEDNWVAAAEWAEERGADITSTSLGYLDFDDGEYYSVDELDGNTSIITIASDIAASKGMLVVNSAGNSGNGESSIIAPADGDSVLAVGAIDVNGDIVSFSSRGPTGDGRIKPDVVAQGHDVFFAYPATVNSYEKGSGTSFSCPITSGCAALLMQACPDASNMDIYFALKKSGNYVHVPNNDYGWGIFDLRTAREYLEKKAEKDSSLITIDLYPNPAINSVNFSILSNGINNAELYVYDYSGKLVNKYELNVSEYFTYKTINISSLRKGLYYLKFLIGGEEIIKKLVIAE